MGYYRGAIIAYRKKISLRLLPYSSYFEFGE